MNAFRPRGYMLAPIHPSANAGWCSIICLRHSTSYKSFPLFCGSRIVLPSFSFNCSVFSLCTPLFRTSASIPLTIWYWLYTRLCSFTLSLIGADSTFSFIPLLDYTTSFGASSSSTVNTSTSPLLSFDYCCPSCFICF